VQEVGAVERSSHEVEVFASTCADAARRTGHVAALRQPHEVAASTGHAPGLGAVAFSPAGHTLVTGGNDRTVRLWDTDFDRVTARICAVAQPRITREQWDRYFPGVDSAAARSVTATSMIGMR
jgi:WD40 repeat protein